MSIDTLEQDLESAINNAYQKIDSKDSVAIISQMITGNVHHSRHYLLSDYSLENKRLYYYSKLYLPNIESLGLRVLQESQDQTIVMRVQVLALVKLNWAGTM